MMKPHRRKRLYWIITILCGVGCAVSLAIYALGQNIDLYFTPSQFVAHQPLPTHHVFRVGGIVKKDSFKREANSLKVYFILTDYVREIPVQYTGVLPSLFREGQGVVVQGQLNEQRSFVADEVLAKHDEKYMPPGVKAVSLK